MRWTTLLIDHPWLALLGATALAIVWKWTRSRIALVAAVLWVAYAGWEITGPRTERTPTFALTCSSSTRCSRFLTVLAVWSAWRTCRRE